LFFVVGTTSVYLPFGLKGEGFYIPEGDINNGSKNFLFLILPLIAED
jgi:hypothetical protein